MGNTMLTMDEKQAWKQRYFRYMDSFMKMCLADLPDARMPRLEFGEDDEVYTNNVIIHIGLNRIEAENEEEMISTVSYMLGHEIQHIRSTTEKAWKWGLEGGLRTVCEELSIKIEGRPRRFIKPRDYDNFIQDLNKMGYKLSPRALQQFVHFIMNSLEDGRIERIRSIKRPGFYNFMVLYRGREWEKYPVQGTSLDSMDAREKLSTILNQVLTLSTMSIYQKEFTLHYAGTDLETKARGLMPHIARGISSSDCRHCMKEGIEICRKLAYDIAEASKLTPLEELISKLIEQFSEKQEYNGKSNDEETESNQGKSPFGQSDIVIELDDEEFDKLAENAEESDDKTGSGMRVIIKRKNPKADDSKSDSRSSGSSEEASGNETGNGKDVSDDTKSTVKPGENAEANDSDQGISADNQLNNSNQSSEKNSSKPMTDDKQKDSSVNEHDISTPNEGEGDMTGQSGSSCDNAGMEEKIKEAMKEAAEKAAGEVETAQSGTASTRKQVVDKVSDNSEAPDVQSVAGSYKEPVTFTEVKREYEVDEQMPFELQGKAVVFKRKIQKLFKNQESPCVRGQKSGRIKATDIYKLAINEMDFFARNGRTAEFDGCAYFLADNSGSMGYGKGSKRYHCCNALSVIEDGFSKVMPLKIVAFDAQNDTFVTHEVIKNWGERNSNSFSYNFMKKGRSGGGNKDGFSIRVATKELLSRSEKKKILIVLSDGSPSCYSSYVEGTKDVNDAVKKARASGIEVVGIYFSSQHDAEEEDIFRKMYEKNYVITEPEMIGEELARLMKRFCFR